LRERATARDETRIRARAGIGAEELCRRRSGRAPAPALEDECGRP
jgi:hypothetical protein